MRGPSHGTMARAREAKAVLEKRLKGHPDVAAIGIGYRERDGRLVQRLCVRVHVRKKFPRDAVPAALRLPLSVRGVPIDVIESNYTSHAPSPSARFNPLIGGIVIANARRFAQTGKVGTAGCVLTNFDGARFVLSNWHVLYGVGGVDGERVVQPRPSGTINDIGLTRRGIISTRVDCAVAELHTTRGAEPDILGLDDVVLARSEARVGLLVKKSGATGIGEGVIVETDLDPEVVIDGTLRSFVDQIEIRPRPGASVTALNAAAGDSGAVWISEDDSGIVGLHFGGDVGRAIANPIDAVVEALAATGVDIGL